MAGWEAMQQGAPDPFFPEGRVARDRAAYREEQERRVMALELAPEDGYSCGSNYCDDPACTFPHPELL